MSISSQVKNLIFFSSHLKCYLKKYPTLKYIIDSVWMWIVGIEVNIVCGYKFIDEGIAMLLLSLILTVCGRPLINFFFIYMYIIWLFFLQLPISIYRASITIYVLIYLVISHTNYNHFIVDIKETWTIGKILLWGRKKTIKTCGYKNRR